MLSSLFNKVYSFSIIIIIIYLAHPEAYNILINGLITLIGIGNSD